MYHMTTTLANAPQRQLFSQFTNTDACAFLKQILRFMLCSSDERNSKQNAPKFVDLEKSWADFERTERENESEEYDLKCEIDKDMLMKIDRSVFDNTLTYMSNKYESDFRRHVTVRLLNCYKKK